MASAGVGSSRPAVADEPASDDTNPPKRPRDRLPKKSQPSGSGPATPRARGAKGGKTLSGGSKRASGPGAKRPERPGFGIRSEPAPPAEPRPESFDRSTPRGKFTPGSQSGGRSGGGPPFRGGSRGGGSSGSGFAGNPRGRPAPWSNRGGPDAAPDRSQDRPRADDRQAPGGDRARSFDRRPGSPSGGRFGPPTGRPSDRGRPGGTPFRPNAPYGARPRPAGEYQRPQGQPYRPAGQHGASDRPAPPNDRPARPFNRSTGPDDRPRHQFERPYGNPEFRRPFEGSRQPFDARPDRRPQASPGAGPGAPRRPWGQEDRRPTAPSPAGLLDPGEELVAGRRPVEEAFVARRAAIRLLVVPQRRQALERLVLHATSLRIPIVEIEGGTLTAIAGFDGHQGIALVVGPRQFASLDEILARAIERGEPPFVLVLDSLEDPQNVGTLLRSAEAAGIHGVIFPTRRQAPLSPSAIKASAGAVEHLLLCPVDDLPGAISDLRIRGLRVVGAEAGAPLTARQSDLRGPLAIVVGSEGQGLSPTVRRRCDFVVRIPMRGAIGSLNAAVAGSVLLFEAVAQRDPDGLASIPPPARPHAADEPRESATSHEAAPSAETDPSAGSDDSSSTEPSADQTVADDLLPGGPEADGSDSTLA